MGTYRSLIDQLRSFEHAGLEFAKGQDVDADCRAQRSLDALHERFCCSIVPLGVRWREFPFRVETLRKWHTESRNVQKGDVVLVQDLNALRSKWKMALVEEPLLSEDGRVRRCEISYPSTGGTRVTVKRPVQKLIVIVPQTKSRTPSKKRKQSTPLENHAENRLTKDGDWQGVASHRRSVLQDAIVAVREASAAHY